MKLQRGDVIIEISEGGIAFLATLAIAERVLGVQFGRKKRPNRLELMQGEDEHSEVSD